MPAEAYMIRRVFDGAYSTKDPSRGFDHVGYAWRSLAQLRRHLRAFYYADECVVVSFRLIPKIETRFSEKALTRMKRREKTAFVGYMVRFEDNILMSSGRRQFTRKGRLWRSLEEVIRAHSPRLRAVCTLIQYDMRPIGSAPLKEFHAELTPLVHYVVRSNFIACGLAEAEYTTTTPRKATCPNCLKTKALAEAKKA
jgi:hypothetical protein